MEDNNPVTKNYRRYSKCQQTIQQIVRTAKTVTVMQATMLQQMQETER